MSYSASSSNQYQSSGGPSAPGWFPTGDGNQRYWNGYEWTNNIAPLYNSAPTQSELNNWALGAHLAGLFAGIIGALIVFLIKKDESPFIRQHASEALNWQITGLAGALLGVIAIIAVTVGTQSIAAFLLVYVLFIVFYGLTVIFSIMGAIAANKGQPFRYPINIRFVS